MPDFTKGEWILTPQYYHDKPMIGITAIDGADYTPVALVEHEDDANLFVHARKMYYLLKDICRIYNEKAQCKREDNSPAFMMALVAEHDLVNMARELLDRINRKQAEHEWDYKRQVVSK